MSIRVLLVDDSALMRQTLAEVLNACPDIALIGAVADPVFAMQRMCQEWPDVVVLDIEMPRMDGLTFLRKIMHERPTPVIICSTLTAKAAVTTLDAMAAGAFAVIEKPTVGLRSFLGEHAQAMMATIRAASQANAQKLAPRSSLPRAVPQSLPPPQRPLRTAPSPRLLRTTECIVAIGTSTGGTQALEYMLTQLPAACPGLVIVQHMPPAFTAAFAQRLNRLCAITVQEAQPGDRVLPGHALIAPGGRHLVLRRDGAQYTVDVLDGPLVSRHRPSVNVLFRSVAQAAGCNAMGMLLTGMGDDGAAGLLEMRRAGAHTVAQDAHSCVVYGMPKAAIERDAAVEVLPLSALAKKISTYHAQHALVPAIPH